MRLKMPEPDQLLDWCYDHEHDLLARLFMVLYGIRGWYIIFYVPFKHRRYNLTLRVTEGVKIRDWDGDYWENNLWFEMGTYWGCV